MTDYENRIINAIRKSLPSVITIAANKDVAAVQAEMLKMGVDPTQFSDRLSEEAKDGKISISSGSAFIVDAKAGIVLTNKHVVQDKEAAFSAVIGNRHYDIEIVAQDPLADLAITKIKNAPAGLSALPLGHSRNLKLGETVVTIGNALGEFQNTVSVGIVSGLSRFLSAVTDMEGHHERLRGLIQTDAAINPGNSGGPLINLEGEVVGINTAVVFGAQSIGFAIPIDRAKKDLEQIRSVGHIQTPFLGIRYVLVNKQIREHFNAPVDHGALIIREGLPGDHAILPGSTAAIAGLRERDIILAVNGKDITEKETLEDVLDNCKVGDTLSLSVLRGKKNIALDVALEDRAKFV